MLIAEPEVNRGEWPLGGILQAYPGSDGLVKVVKLKKDLSSIHYVYENQNNSSRNQPACSFELNYTFILPKQLEISDCVFIYVKEENYNNTLKGREARLILL